MNIRAQGFTLIELLVVVLIIGILAAVALPQYQKAVARSRIGALLPVMKTIVEAEENYFLANGTYTINPANLDIDMPTACTKKDNRVDSWNCFNNIQLFFADVPRSIYLHYYESANKRVATISFNYANYTTPRAPISCEVNNNYPLGKYICDTLVK